jgi:hypothetical protein
MLAAGRNSNFNALMVLISSSALAKSVSSADTSIPVFVKDT